jgi:hypothetical protein
LLLKPLVLFLAAVFLFSFHASPAHAAYEISDSTVQFLYHFNLPASSTESSSSSRNITTVGWSSTTSSITNNLNNAVYSTSFGDTLTASVTPVNIFTDVSVGAWYNASTTGTDERIVSFPSIDNVVLYHNFDGTNDTPKCQFTDTNQNHVWSIIGSSTSGGKHFIVCTWNHSTGDGLLYEDGGPTSSIIHANSSGAIKGGNSSLYIGKGIGTDSPAKGSIDEVFLTDNVLTPSTISSLWNNGNGQEICLTFGCAGTSTVVGFATGTLNQYKSDATTVINEGSSTTQTTVKFGATLISNGTSTVQFQVESQPFNHSFANVANITSTFVASGTAVMISTSSLPDGLYKWQARAIDGNNVTSLWKTLSSPAASYDLIVNRNPTVTVAATSSDVQALYNFAHELGFIHEHDHIAL